MNKKPTRVLFLATFSSENKAVDEYDVFEGHMKLLGEHISDNVYIFGYIINDRLKIYRMFTISSKNSEMVHGPRFNRSAILKEMETLKNIDIFYFYGHFNGMFFGMLGDGFLDIVDVAQTIAKLSPKIICIDACFGLPVDVIYEFASAGCNALFVGAPSYSYSTSFLDFGMLDNVLPDMNNIESIKSWISGVVKNYNKVDLPDYACILFIDIAAIKVSLEYIRKLFISNMLTFDEKNLITEDDPITFDLVKTLEESKYPIPNHIYALLDKAIIAKTQCKNSRNISITHYLYLYDGDVLGIAWYKGYKPPKK